MKICGNVVRGDGRGRELGFPTANLSVTSDAKLPDIGVYAGTVTIGESDEKIWSAIHIGPRPTIGDQKVSIEAHLLDFSGDLYDKSICLNMVKRLRDIEKFDTIKALQDAIEGDCNSVRALIP